MKQFVKFLTVDKIVIQLTILQKFNIYMKARKRLDKNMISKICISGQYFILISSFELIEKFLLSCSDILEPKTLGRHSIHVMYMCLLHNPITIHLNLHHKSNFLLPLFLLTINLRPFDIHTPFHFFF